LTVNTKGDPDYVVIFDTTLRDGEQAPGAAMTIPEKIQIAHQLARLGVDVIEAGFPISSPAQDQAVRRISEEVQGPVICALARATEQDVKAAAGAVGGARNPRIHTFIATSDIHLESKFGHDRYGKTLADKRKTVMRMAVDAVSLARTYVDDVEFSAEDAGRSPREYLCEIVQAAIDAGATTINIPDTTGYCVPSEYATLIDTIKDGCTIPAGVVISTHCHDDLGLAVANSLAGVSSGARQVECTINGIGERAGNAALEEVVMALRVRSDRFGYTTGIVPNLLMDASRLVSTYAGFAVQPNKAIVGANAFSHEAGIHQDGVLKRRDTYEIMKAEDVGHSIEDIRLGRHSGRHGLFSRLQKLGVDLEEARKEDVYRRFVDLADQKKEIFDRDLLHLVDQSSKSVTEGRFVLERMELSVSTVAEPTASVRLNCRQTGQVREETAVGDGPVDALYRAIDHAVAEAHELVDYTIRSVSRGADALGEVLVTIRDGAVEFNGSATSTDVLRASAEAYVAALNRLSEYRAEDDERDRVVIAQKASA
jgi:2-isopropylmalate synthase